MKKVLSCIVSTCYAIVQIRGAQGARPAGWASRLTAGVRRGCAAYPATRGASGLLPSSPAPGCSDGLGPIVAGWMGHPAPEPPGPLPVGIPHFLRGGSTTYPQGLFACVTYFFLIYFLCWKQSVFASVFHHLFQPDSGSGPCGASQRRVQRNATQTPPHVFSRSDPPNAPVPALLLHQRRLPKAPASGSPFRRRRSVGGVLGNRAAELVRSP